MGDSPSPEWPAGMTLGTVLTVHCVGGVIPWADSSGSKGNVAKLEPASESAGSFLHGTASSSGSLPTLTPISDGL